MRLLVLFITLIFIDVQSIHFKTHTVLLGYILRSLCQRRHRKQVKFIPVARQD